MKIWDKGYELDKLVESFTVGLDPELDLQLVEYDCLGSIAHAKMLNKTGFLTDEQTDVLVGELNEIIRLHREGLFVIDPSQEDCHTAIEAHLTEKLGNPGRMIHTARSRNDQVLTALRLYYKDRLQKVIKEQKNLTEKVKAFIEKFGSIPIPGFTHTRRAMPSSISMWAGGLLEGAKDNRLLLETALLLIDQSPLGTGAGYGVPLNLDRQMTSDLLGFGSVQENPVHVQLSRGKYESTIMHCLIQIMYDLNRYSCDLILFSEPAYGFFRLPDQICTGSSIMPQKKNPDVLELLRASFHQVAGFAHQVQNMAISLVTGYNRDLQLLKEPVMRSFDIVLRSLSVSALIFEQLQVDESHCREAMTPEIYATEEAYRLVEQGIPFREAYVIIAKKHNNQQ